MTLTSFRSLSLAGLILVAGQACTRGAPAAAHVEARPEPPSPPATAPVQVLPNPALARTPAGLSIADVAERALPSVVNISLTKVSKTNGMQFPFPFPFGFQDPGQQRQEQQGMGSGVIMSADGIILTNNHVVSDATEIKVTTHDNREFDAKVVGTDPKTDLAVIKLQGGVSDLTPAHIGSSQRLRLGDVVLAIGNPFGVGQTVTMGIVSAKGRADLGIVDYEDFIQTDAAINPGNSGGALINTEGELVGINTAILSRSGGYQGIGFAIPTEMAVPIMDSLRTHGHVTRGWLGVGIQDVDSDLAAALKLPVASGVLLSDVRAGSPAEKAGLKRGDVVTRIDGKPVATVGQLRNMVALAGASKGIQVEILRDGKQQVIPVKLGEMPSDDSEQAFPGAPDRGNSRTLDGLVLEGLDRENRQRFRVPLEVKQGVLVTRVSSGSTAAKAGLMPGDVILEVNRARVMDLASFQELYNKASGNVLLLINRRGGTVYVVVRR